LLIGYRRLLTPVNAGAGSPGATERPIVLVKEGDLMKSILTLLLCLWTLAACASTEDGQQTASSRDCFRAEQVNGYGVIDNNHIRISVGANRHYILTTLWNSRDLDWTHAIAIRSSTGRICTGNGLGIQLIGGDPSRTYPVSEIARAPDDEPVQGS
jgi:hypothetical protein